MDNVLREDGSALLGMAKPRAILCCERLSLVIWRSPGIRCDIRQIVITEGALEGVNLCASLLTNPGDSVWLEEPGYGARSGFQRAGLRVRGMAVDDEGCVPTASRSRPAHFHLSFTPVSLWEHHERRAPSGARGCPPARAWIVEDDYDSEFRHSGEPIPAMLGMVPDAPVVYLGTFSKRCSGVAYRFYGYAARAGGCCSGRHWRAAARGHRAEQRALASFIEKDTMRAIWQRCAACTVNVATAARGAGARDNRAVRRSRREDAPDGGDGGVNDRTLAQQARQFQLAPAALSHFYLDPQRARSDWCGMAIPLLLAISRRCGP